MKKRKDVKENGPDLWQIPPLRADDHKYTRGHVVIYGGAEMTGAPRMAAIAAQRTGAGVVTLAVPKSVFPIYAGAMLSVIVRALTAKEDFKWILQHRRVSTILLGPGAEPDDLREPLEVSLKSGLPLVLDAGALTLIAEDKAIRKKLIGAHAVYTPHDGEYKKLTTALKLKPSADPTMLAEALGGVVLLKGPQTIIASPAGKIVRNTAKAPWLATAGSGDVLAGMIASLIAQGMNGFDAACAGAWLHSQAARKFGRGMIAEDLLTAIPLVLPSLK